MPLVDLLNHHYQGGWRRIADDGLYGFEYFVIVTLVTKYLIWLFIIATKQDVSIALAHRATLIIEITYLDIICIRSQRQHPSFQSSTLNDGAAFVLAIFAVMRLTLSGLEDGHPCFSS